MYESTTDDLGIFRTIVETATLEGRRKATARATLNGRRTRLGRQKRCD